MSDAPVFKKRRRPGAVTARQSSSAIADTVDTIDTAADTTDLIDTTTSVVVAELSVADARLLQSERAKQRKGGLKLSASGSATHGAGAAGTEGAAVSAVVTKEGAFTTAFERQSDHVDQQTKIDMLREQYVNEKLAAQKRLWHEQALAAATTRQFGDAAAGAAPLAASDANSASSHASANANAGAPVAVSSAASDLTALLANALPPKPTAAAAPSNRVVTGAWLTGIEEVELPMAARVRNMEETARVTKELMERQQREPAQRHWHNAPANFSTLSASHSRYHASGSSALLTKLARIKDEAAADLPENATADELAAATADVAQKAKHEAYERRVDQRNRSSDSRAVQQFKKHNAGRR
jgi:hypothetical protein